MDFSKLEQNICDMIKEQQIKIGYRSETVRLYYPLLSLNRFLHTDLTAEGMRGALEAFCGSFGERVGSVQVSEKNGRFCFCFSPEVSDYVHHHMPQDRFLQEFIQAVSRHGVSIEEIIAVFRKFSGCVHVEEQCGEFDYLLYFEDGKPDAYRYCITQEGEHLIYHRFTAEDYEDFR